MEKNGSLAAPSSKQKRRPRGEWLKEVRSLRDSGLSPEEYAAKKGLVLSSLKFWKRVLRNDVEARTTSAVPAFLPVSVLPAARTPSSDAVVMVEIDLAMKTRAREARMKYNRTLSYETCRRPVRDGPGTSDSSAFSGMLQKHAKISPMS